MITEKEVPDFLEDELPEIKIELEKNNKNIFNLLHVFTSYTKKCAEIGNINKLKSCFVIANKLLREGNNAVKSAVENVYVFSVSSLIEIASPIQKQVQKILPENLKNAYLNHITDLNSLNDWKDENCLFQIDIRSTKIVYKY